MFALIQLLPPFLAARFGKFGKNLFTDVAGLVINNEQIKGWCNTFLLQKETKPLESNFFSDYGFFMGSVVYGQFSQLVKLLLPLFVLLHLLGSLLKIRLQKFVPLSNLSELDQF